ncbi:lysophospholipase [Photobacterium sp. SDRW27]|uniref:alpha/beta hydrolase n=1 Tax=Photobacterium obscurum TaxID=2829490 RepID=UPI002244BB79|nr:alpha/beta hydrolase [Photobacterium obscurum]MCW8329199.1 lysophospholipase [Photobacterium obscurum]
MKNILLAILLFYMLFSLTFCALQRKLLYFPQPASDIYGEANIHFDINGELLNGWVLNEGQAKALIYYGGNAENIEANIPFFEAVLPAYTVYLIPYRGYGDNAGVPTEQALYSDAVHIFQQIKARHESISLMGRSLGSGIATYVAANRKVDKLVLVTPFDSIENVAKDIYWMLPVSLFIKDKFRSAEHVKDITAKTYIFVAENDQVIPRARTERLIALFNEQLVEVIVVSGAGHNTISQYSTYVDGIRRALN